MSILVLQALLRRRRRRLLAAALIAVLSCTVVAAHARPMAGQMGEEVAMCLAVVAVAALPAAGRASVGVVRAAVSVPAPAPAALLVSRRPPAPRNRAGPALLQVFLR